MKKKYIDLKKIFIIFFIIFFNFPYRGFSIIPIGNIIRLLNKNESLGASNHLRLSLDPKKEICSYKARLGEIGYQYVREFSEIGNDNEKNTLFSNPYIALRHMHPWWALFIGTYCNSWDTKVQRYPAFYDKAVCYKAGAANARRICVGIYPAPKNKRELYIRLAKYQVDVLKETSPFLNQVLSYNTDAINAGFCNFKDINSTLKNQVSSDIDNYIAKYPGQKMVCAFDVTDFIFFSADTDRCSNPEECANNMDDLIKCLLLPFGPAPRPFAPYIAAEQTLDIVPDKNSTINNPIARLRFKILESTEFSSFNLFDSSGVKKTMQCSLDINISQNNTISSMNSSCDGSALPAPTSNTKSTIKYMIQFNIINNSICGSILSRQGEIFVAPVDIGCIPIEGDYNYNFNTINNSSNLNKPFLDINSYEKDIKILPTNIERFLNLSSSSIITSNDEIFYRDEGDTFKTIYTAFRSGFSHNKYNQKNRFLIKDICTLYNKSSNNISKTVIFDGIFEKNIQCEDDIEFSDGGRKNNLVFCEAQNEEESKLVDNPANCPAGSTLNFNQIGFKCKDGTFANLGASCPDVMHSTIFEDDYAGTSICPRGMNGILSSRSYIINLDLLGKKYFNKITENSKLLIPSSKNGVVTIGDPDIKKFSDFSQVDLNNFVNLYGYTIKDEARNIIYNYESPAYKIDLGNSNYITTSFSDENGPFVIDLERMNIIPSDDLNLCVSFNRGDFSQPEKKWSYILQFPMYYSNYDIASFAGHKNNLLYKNTLSFEKVDGIFDPRAISSLNSLDIIKQDVIMIPTKKDTSGSVPNPRFGNLNIINLSDPLNKIDNNLFKNSGSVFFENFNAWGDYFENLKNNKIFYTDGTNLLNGKSDNLFDTSGCNFIEFEMYSGGSSSKSKNMNGKIDDFKAPGADVTNLCVNGAHAGENGGYVKGSFFIRPNTQIIVKVAGPSGFISNNYNGSDEIVNSGDYSAIWIRETGENKEYLNNASISPKLMIKVFSGSEGHICSDNNKCNNLKIHDVHGNMLAPNNNIFELDNGSYSSQNFGSTNQKRSYMTDNFLNFNQLIAIEEFRGPSLSSFCGQTTSSEETWPISFPVIKNIYNEYGIVKESTNIDFSKLQGTGDFNKIGLYFYENFKNNIFSGPLNWSTRKDFNNKYESLCKTVLNSCWNNSTSSLTKINFANDSSFNIDPLIRSVDDINLYCPGLGGCYFSSDSKSVSSSGTAGLVKISCKKVRY